MRIALLSLLLGLWAGAALGEALLPLASPAPSPSDVLNFLLGMGLPPEFTAALSAALAAGFQTGRATTTVTLLLLQDLTKIPKEQGEGILEVLRYALSQGFIVDTGLAGSSMMNEVRKLLALGRSGEEISRVLSLRLGFLLATRAVLARYGLVPGTTAGPDAPLAPTDRLILELAWAVGDFILWEGGSPADPGILGYVQGRLCRLAALGLIPSELSERATAALTPEILAEIARLAFQPERR
ncbi:MAG: hypothetical protein ACPLRP_01770 [Candidatus Bipolaricaulaceae bacterium]